MQNIPVRTEDGRKIRKAFVASPGMKLVSADYSQIELRLLSEVAEVPALRKAFQDGVDIHAMTASEMFGVPVKDMPSEVRRRAKAINFGIIYGISAFGLANQLGIEREEAGAYIKKYFERFPGIRDYMDETREFCRQHGYVETLFGRKCHYPEIKNSNPSIRAFNERAAINARLQGSAADIIRRAMIRIEPELEKAKLRAQMLLQVHDELIFEVPVEEVDDDHPRGEERDGGGAAPGGGAQRALTGRRPRRRQLGRGALKPLGAALALGIGEIAVERETHVLGQRVDAEVEALDRLSPRGHPAESAVELGEVAETPSSHGIRLSPPAPARACAASAASSRSGLARADAACIGQRRR